MNKAEFAVCRIKEKLPGNQGFATKGSGCVVHCEKLTSSWGWKCHYFIVTPSVVLCREDLASDKVFVAEFLSKDKRGLETFEIKQMADVCKDVVGRRLDNLDRDLYLTFISVEPLDKRGFLKKMVKKGSLQTFRPLDCLEFEKKSVEELTEGLYCHVISELFSESTNSALSTQTFKLVYDSETGVFILQDFGGLVKTFNQEIPPIGAVIVTKKGEFAGLLRNFSDNCVTPVFLPDSSITENGQGEDATVSDTGVEACATDNEDFTEPKINMGQENRSGSDASSSSDTNQVEGMSLRGNNNTLLSSDDFPTDSEFTNIAPSVVVEDENVDQVNVDVRGQDSSNKTDVTQGDSNATSLFQECPDNLIPGNRTEKVDIENLVMSTDSMSYDQSNFVECEKEGVSDMTEENLYPLEGQEKAEGSDEAKESSDKATDEAHEAEVTHKADGVPNQTEGLAKLEEEGGCCLVVEGPGEVEEGPKVAVEGPCGAVEGPGEEEESPYKTEGADSATIVSDKPCSVAADDSRMYAKLRQTITRHDSSLTTVIQVGEMFAQTELTENKALKECGDSEMNISEGVSPESQGVIAAEHSNIEQPSTEQDDSEMNISDNIPREIQNVIATEQANITEPFTEQDDAEMNISDGVPPESQNVIATEQANITEPLTGQDDSEMNISESIPCESQNVIPTKQPNITEPSTKQDDSEMNISESIPPESQNVIATEQPNITQPSTKQGDSEMNISETLLPESRSVIIVTEQSDAEQSSIAHDDSEMIMSENVAHESRSVIAVEQSDIEQSSTELDGSEMIMSVAPESQSLMTAEQSDTDEPSTKHDDSEMILSENVSPESQGVIATEHSDVEQQSATCFPDTEDGETTEPSMLDHPVVDEENAVDVCAYTDSEATELVGAKPGISSELDSPQIPSSSVAIDTSQELSQEDQELSSASENTVDTLYDHCDTSPIEDVIVTAAKDNNFKDDGPETLCQKNSVEVSLSSEIADDEEMRDLQSNDITEIEVKEQENSTQPDVSFNLEKVDAEGNVEVAYNEVKDFVKHSETDILVDSILVEQFSPRLDGIQTAEDDEAVVTQKDFVEITKNGSAVAEICENSDHKKSVSFEEKTAESYEVIRETPIDDHSTEQATNFNASEKGLVTTAERSADSLQNGTGNKEVESGETSFDDSVVLQRVDADALLTETVTNNSRILGDLGSCLDTEYQYGKVPCWRDLAELLAIPPEAYEHCATFSVTSPTEDLFVFLSATKPQLTIQDIKEALREIDRVDVAQLLDRKIAGGVISEESVVASLVERDDTDVLGRMALKLDRKSLHNWKHLALQLSVPHRVLRNFGSHQRHNSSLMLLKFIPIFDPELTLDHLKCSLASIGRQDAVAVLDKAGIPGDEPVKDVLDDSDLLDQITDLLNEDSPSPHWRHLAKELKIPQEKCKIFEPSQDDNSPTKLLFRSIENCEPDLTFEELVLALVAMKRQDALDVLPKYFSGDDIDWILEENNLLAPVEDQPDETKS